MSSSVRQVRIDELEKKLKEDEESRAKSARDLEKLVIRIVTADNEDYQGRIAVLYGQDEITAKEAETLNARLRANESRYEDMVRPLLNLQNLDASLGAGTVLRRLLFANGLILPGIVGPSVKPPLPDTARYRERTEKNKRGALCEVYNSGRECNDEICSGKHECEKCCAKHPTIECRFDI